MATVVENGVGSTGPREPGALSALEQEGQPWGRRGLSC